MTFIRKHVGDRACTGNQGGESAQALMNKLLTVPVVAQAALDLVFKGKEQPSGDTEPLLHAWRLKKKASA